MGCPLEISEENGNIKVVGNTCKRGELYGKNEYAHPVRSLTSLIELSDGAIASVRTSSPIPKERLFDVLELLKGRFDSSLKAGDIAIKDVLGLGADIIVTGTNRIG